MLPPALLQVERRLLHALRRGIYGLRPGRTHPDPGHQVGDLGIRQPAFRRHLQIGVPIMDGLDEPALFRLTRGDGGLARFAACEHSLARIEAQLTLELFRGSTVAFVTTLHEHWTHLLLEELEAVGREVGGGGRPRPQDKMNREP